MCYPNFYEDYNSFISRCSHELDYPTLNKNFRARRSMYLKEGLGDIPFLLGTERQMQRYIEEYALEVEMQLDETYNDVALFLALNGIDSGWDLLINNDDLKQLLQDGYVDVGIYTDNRYSNKYGGVSTDNLIMTSFMISVLLSRFTIGNPFVKATRDQINTVIRNGKSEEDIFEKLKNHNNRPRAKVISATELGFAQASAELYAMKKIAKEKPVAKYWVGVLDDRIRDSHFEATSFYTRSNAIPLEDFFNVNGSLMKHPHDINAPAKEIVNCRCYLGYVL